MPNVMILSRQSYRKEFSNLTRSNISSIKDSFGLLMMENDVKDDASYPYGTFSIINDSKGLYAKQSIISRQEASDLLAKHMTDSVT